MLKTLDYLFSHFVITKSCCIKYLRITQITFDCKEVSQRKLGLSIDLAQIGTGIFYSHVCDRQGPRMSLVGRKNANPRIGGEFVPSATQHLQIGTSQPGYLKIVTIALSTFSFANWKMQFFFIQQKAEITANHGLSMSKYLSGSLRNGKKRSPFPVLHFCPCDLQCSAKVQSENSSVILF